MTKAQLTAVLAGAILITVGAVSSVSAGDTVKHSITFAAYASDGDDLYWALVLAESIREFGGSLSDAPIWVYLNDAAPELDTMYAPRRDSLKVAIGHSHTPAGMQKIIYSGKVYASGTAEKELGGTTAILAWLDPDVIFVKEPSAFVLDSNISLGYRPVQLVNISSRYNEPLNEFWGYLYQDLGVVDSQIFPMMTTTDMVQIRAHFNAGMLIVRPERGILRSWPLALEKVWADPAIQRMCSADKRTAIFLHQAALSGAILKAISRDQTVDLPSTYNYAMMFADRLPADQRAASLDDLVMFRHDMALSNPALRVKISDSSKIFRWVKQRWPK